MFAMRYGAIVATPLHQIKKGRKAAKNLHYQKKSFLQKAEVENILKKVGMFP